MFPVYPPARLPGRLTAPDVYPIHPEYCMGNPQQLWVTQPTPTTHPQTEGRPPPSGLLNAHPQNMYANSPTAGTLLHSSPPRHVGFQWVQTHPSGPQVWLPPPRPHLPAICSVPDCQRQAEAGAPGSEAYCPAHREEESHKSRRCLHLSCARRPCYSYSSESARYCHIHRLPGMVDVNSRRCQHEGCPKTPYFAMLGEKPRMCSSHKLEGMQDVRSKRCEFSGCQKHPHFGDPGNAAKFCSEHKLPKMVNVKNRRCQEPGCPKEPLYASEGNRPQCCAHHKLPGMIDVKNKRCESIGCSRCPAYGFPLDALRFCATHKVPGMQHKNSSSRDPGGPAAARNEEHQESAPGGRYSSAGQPAQAGTRSAPLRGAFAPGAPSGPPPRSAMGQPYPPGTRSALPQRTLGQSVHTSAKRSALSAPRGADAPLEGSMWSVQAGSKGGSVDADSKGGSGRVATDTAARAAPAPAVPRQKQIWNEILGVAADKIIRLA